MRLLLRKSVATENNEFEIKIYCIFEFLNYKNQVQQKLKHLNILNTFWFMIKPLSTFL